MTMLKSLFAAASMLAISVTAASAAQPQPQPAPSTPAIAPPQDIPFPGVIALAVDATDLDHAIFTVHETVPVSGPITLLYPRWLPGSHSP